jgi:hypothetical protein
MIVLQTGSQNGKTHEKSAAHYSLEDPSITQVEVVFWKAKVHTFSLVAMLSN